MFRYQGVCRPAIDRSDEGNRVKLVGVLHDHSPISNLHNTSIGNPISPYQSMRSPIIIKLSGMFIVHHSAYDV